MIQRFARPQLEDHVFMICHHISTWVCGLARGHMERRRCLAIVFTLRIQLDCKHSWHRCDGLWTKSLKQGQKPNNHKFSHGAGCGLGRSWLWLWSGSGLDRSGSGSGSAQKWAHMFVYVAAWMQHDKKRTTRCAGSKCAAWLLGRLALQLATVWQLGCATVAAWLLDCLTA